MSNNCWENRIPCWYIMGCSKLIYPECIVFKDRSKPCLEHAMTRSEELLRVPKSCEHCRVFRFYGRK